MIVDGRSLEDETVIDADLCIVGSGPAGIALAGALGVLGIRIAMIESGGLDREPSRDALGAGTSVGIPYPRLERTHVRGFGGTSLHWGFADDPHGGWNARPLEAIDFEARSELPFSGWPIGRDDLEPFYRAAQDVCRLGPFAYEPEDWNEAPESIRKPAPEGLTWHLFQSGQHSFAGHLDEFRSSDNVTVFHHLTATELITGDDARRVVEVAATQRRGGHVRISARRFVLATGGIENPRLLLLSDRVRPNGLGNDHDLVGRFFMERLTGPAGVVIPTDRGRAMFESLARSYPFESALAWATMSLGPEVLRREGLRNATFWFWGTSAALASDGVYGLLTLARARDLQPRPRGLLGYARNAASEPLQIGRAIASRIVRSRDGRAEVFRIEAQAEQAPNPESRVTLSSRRDEHGRRLPRLAWLPSDGDQASIRRSIDLLDESLQGAGLGRIRQKIGDRTPGVVLYGLEHHVGTTRMSDDPKTGVVDSNCRVHGVENLFIAGSSVFPTEGFANPTFTIAALALRLAEHLKTESVA